MPIVFKIVIVTYGLHNFTREVDGGKPLKLKWERQIEFFFQCFINKILEPVLRYNNPIPVSHLSPLRGVYCLWLSHTVPVPLQVTPWGGGKGEGIEVQ